MAMITGPLKWYTVASRLEQAVYAELTTKPARHGVVPGSIAWDECDCGLLAVSRVQTYLSDSPPDPVAQPFGNCDAVYEVAELVLQVIRCVPGAGDQTLAPTVAELDASAQGVERDGYELLKAVSVELCQMNTDREISGFMLRPMTAQGPSGVCGGNELRAYVALMRN